MWFSASFGKIPVRITSCRVRSARHDRAAYTSIATPGRVHYIGVAASKTDALQCPTSPRLTASTLEKTTARIGGGSGIVSGDRPPAFKLSDNLRHGAASGIRTGIIAVAIRD